METVKVGGLRIAYRRAGRGASDDPPETFRLADFADCLAGFVAALGIDRPHVLGLSFGAGWRGRWC